MLQLGMTSLNAQDFKFGKVSKEELQEKFNPADSTANATVLYRKEYTSFNLSSSGYHVRRVHERVKIYNKEGFDWATKQIVLSSGGTIDGFKANTYNLVNGEILVKKLTKASFFTEKLNNYWDKIKFTFPSVKKGCVIEYKYSIVLSYSNFQDIYFQDLIPIKKLDVEYIIPKYFKINKVLNPRAEYKPNLSCLKQGGDNKSFTTDVIKANLINVPALRREKFVDDLNNYRAKLILELIAFSPPNGFTTNFATDWETIVEKIFKNKYFGGELGKTRYFKQDIDKLLEEKKYNKKEIVKLIFDYVKSRVKCNGYNNIYAFNGVKKTYKEGIGGVADINLMLVAMLRYAKINANPVLLSTKTNGIPLFPTKRGFNYVVCGIEVKGEVLLLDATKEFTTTNILPLNVLNWQGRIIRPHGSSAWIDLKPKRNSNNTTMISATLNSDLVFEGRVRSQKSDYYAYEYRKEYAGLEVKELIKNLSEDKGEIEISNLVTKNEKDLNKAVMNSYDFTYEDGAEEIGTELYIAPLLFLSEGNNIFNNETRNYPIDFKFPRTRKNIVNISIPEGYKVKSIPESVKMIMSDDLGVYSFLVKNNVNSVQISQALSINLQMIPVNYYSELKEIYKKLVEKNAEKIVLEKI